jgi:hypothetical protein
MRNFDTGATRNNATNKFDYHGFRHPLTEFSFARYMHKHRKQADGKLRDANNWWKLFGDVKTHKDITLKSMDRHLEALKMLQAGGYVYEDKKRAEYIFSLEPLKNPPSHYEIVTEDDCCNGIRFNASAYLLGVLKDEPRK